MLLQLTDVNKIYNGAPLLKHISLTIEDRDRIGLIGVNGCGKSTLLKLITERILPDHIQEGDGEIIKSSHTTIWRRWAVWKRNRRFGMRCTMSFNRCWMHRHACENWNRSWQTIPKQRQKNITACRLILKAMTAIRLM